MDRFEVRPEHMKLLTRIFFGYNDWTEFGAPEVDPKRPYGNSDVYGDLAELLGVEADGVDEYGDAVLSDETKAKLLRIHKEMPKVLGVLARNAAEGISPGWYESPKYYNDWKRVDA